MRFTGLHYKNPRFFTRHLAGYPAGHGVCPEHVHSKCNGNHFLGWGGHELQIYRHSVRSSPAGNVTAQIPNTLPGMVLLRDKRFLDLYSSGSSTSERRGGVMGRWVPPAHRRPLIWHVPMQINSECGKAPVYQASCLQGSLTDPTGPDYRSTPAVGTAERHTPLTPRWPRPRPE